MAVARSLCVITGHAGWVNAVPDWPPKEPRVVGSRPVALRVLCPKHTFQCEDGVNARDEAASQRQTIIPSRLVKWSPCVRPTGGFGVGPALRPWAC